MDKKEKKKKKEEIVSNAMLIAFDTNFLRCRFFYQSQIDSGVALSDGAKAT